MFNFLKRLFFKGKYESTPRGKSFFKYMEAKIENPDHPSIMAYDDALDRMVHKLELKCLEREAEYIKNNSPKKYKVRITQISTDKGWYSDCIGQIFEVYDYDKNKYNGSGVDFGFLIDKRDCELLHI